MSLWDSTSVLGVKINLIDCDDLIYYIVSIVQTDQRAIIAYANVQTINLAYKLDWFRDFINHSQVVFCDGFGVSWAIRFLRGKKLQRFTPPDWFDRLACVCAEHQLSMFFLGTQPEIIERAAEILEHRYPGLKILGTHHGFFDKSFLSLDNKAVVAEINSLSPDILVIGFGMPAQEKWISDNWQILNVHVAFSVGAFFDYLTGDVKRAPRWMTDHGFEWLGRLMIEPRRLWVRYLLGNPIFVWRVLMQRIGIIKYQSPL